jgi:hypothetical protein
MIRLKNDVRIEDGAIGRQYQNSIINRLLLVIL